MKAAAKPAAEVDAYLAAHPPAVRKRLEQLRKAIRKVLPEATEAISYGIPTFRGRRNIIHFAGFEHHVGVYPAPRGVAEFREELAAYEGGKGTVRFPHDAPLPLDLVRRIAIHLGARDAAAARTKARKAVTKKQSAGRKRATSKAR